MPEYWEVVGLTGPDASSIGFPALFDGRRRNGLSFGTIIE